MWAPIVGLVALGVAAWALWRESDPHGDGDKSDGVDFRALTNVLELARADDDKQPPELNRKSDGMELERVRGVELERAPSAGSLIPYEVYRKRIDELERCAASWARAYVPPGLTVSESIELALQVATTAPECVWQLQKERLADNDCTRLFFESYVPGYAGIGSAQSGYSGFRAAKKRVEAMGLSLPTCVERYERRLK